ncbi:MAG: hypothetical protein WEB52_05000 [Dehalococcoidia bacterium]
MAGADEIKWARRVRPETIRRLYTLDAKGIVDDELIDEVGYAFFCTLPQHPDRHTRARWPRDVPPLPQRDQTR